MFPDSSGLSDDSQSGASHLWPTMVPPRYSPPHSHPDDKPPPYSPWARECGGWAESAQRRLAVLRHSRHGRTLRKRRAGEEEEEERGRGRGHRRSMRSRPENGRASVFIFLGTLHTRVCTSCDGVSACECVWECIHMKPDQIRLITRTVYWWICCLNANRLDTPAGALPPCTFSFFFYPPLSSPLTWPECAAPNTPGPLPPIPSVAACENRAPSPSALRGSRHGCHKDFTWTTCKRKLEAKLQCLAQMWTGY